MSDVSRSFELTDSERNLLGRIQQGLPLLADLVRADMVLYSATRAPDRVEAVFEARPRYINFLRPSSMPTSGVITEQDDVELFRVLRCGKVPRPRPRDSAWDPANMRRLFPVVARHRTIAVIAAEYHLADRAMRNHRDPVRDHSLGQLWRMLLAGHIDGAENITALGEHDGLLVVDSEARILYTSAIAESLYRKLGFTKPLIRSKITDLGTDESAFTRAMELGLCTERLVEEGSLTIVKKAIPLVALRHSSWLERLLDKPRDIDGAFVVLHDITDERRREQELKIKATMIQEVHHRVKNNLQTIAALLRLQARRTGSAEAVEILHQTINRVLSVAVVHEFLSHDDSSSVNIKDICQRIVDEVTQSVLDPEKRIQFVIDGGNIALPTQQATPCALVVNELLQNAVEHGFADSWSGTVMISLQDNGNNVVVEITDDGQGLPPGFSFAKGSNLGLQIVSTLVKEDLRGEFELINGMTGADGSGKGVRAIVTIPRSKSIQRMAAGIGV